MTVELDRWLSPQIRNELEQLYYARVNHQARFEVLREDPTFFEAIRQHQPHIGLYSDHGVVHVRDVARQTLTIMERVNGRLIPHRPTWRLASMMGYGVQLAYFHDIGMRDFSAFGRAMHPEFACHSVFSPQLDGIINQIWRENSGNLAWRLTQLSQDGALEQPPQVVLRELLALAMGHSKSKVPIVVLNNPSRLRQLMIETVSTNLHFLYNRQRVSHARKKLADARLQADKPAIDKWSAAVNDTGINTTGNTESGSASPHFHRHYRTIEEAFSWLDSDHPATRELIDDALDTVRVLRCADSLRQRGQVLKTSAGYEIFISRQTATAIISYQSVDNKLYLFETDDSISAGEANIISSELDAECNLRISFSRGEFDRPEATTFAVYAAAEVVEDIQQDALGSFERPDGETAALGLKSASDAHILLEEVDDSAEFVARVRSLMEAQNPALIGRIRLVPSLRETSDRERTIYLAASPVAWDRPVRDDFLQRIRQSGHRTDGIDADKAFQDTRLVNLQPGDVLLEAGSPAAFVYIPMSAGLRIIPLGGYDTLDAQPWTPLGVTGVIRGATRNASAVAEAAVSLLMIPKGVYLREWHRIHTAETFLQALEESSADYPRLFQCLPSIQLSRDLSIEGTTCRGEVGISKSH